MIWCQYNDLCCRAPHQKNPPTILNLACLRTGFLLPTSFQSIPTGKLCIWHGSRECRKLCPAFWCQGGSWSPRLVGNPIPHSGPINLILSPMTPSAPFTPFLRLPCGSYNLKFIHTPKLEGQFDPGPTFQKKKKFPESRSRISTGANLSPKGNSEFKNQATLNSTKAPRFLTPHRLALGLDSVGVVRTYGLCGMYQI